MNQDITSQNASGDIIRSLGWSDDEVTEREISHNHSRLDISRALMSGESALVVAKVISRNGLDPVESAALYGYHVAAEWGVVADPVEGITIFNSRWVDESGWYRLPAISWSRRGEAKRFLDALTPEGIRNGVIGPLAEKVKRPSAVLSSVDDALVDRLDRWRAEALKFSSEGIKLDGLLQQVYAQLFVLRTVEDRALNASIPSPSSVVDTRTGGLSRRKWSAMIKSAKENIGSELFSQDFGKQIPDHVLVGVIRDLYIPCSIPSGDSKYDFSWIDADVLGGAYEKYLSTVLQPGALAPQTDLFLHEERDVERFSVRKRKGVYYTPRFITTYLARSTVDEYFKEARDQEPPHVIDFACGSGAFLVAAVDRMLLHLKRKGGDRPWARQLIDGRYIAGVDIDANAVNLARLRLWQRLLEEPGALPLPSLSAVVTQGDGLNQETWGDLPRQYDIVLGNPPFLATSKVESRERLEANFVTARGRFDFSSLFVEQAIQVLRVGGRFAMVVPNRFFRNTSGATLRNLITEKTVIEQIVDFGVTRPFEADAYVACVVARKRDSTVELPRTVRVLEVASIDSDFLADILLGESTGDGDRVRSFVARHPVGQAPWMLLSEKERMTRVSIESSSQKLDAIAFIAQGIRTGANEFFIFDLISEDSHLSQVQNGLGERALIENDLLKPVIQGSEAQRFSRVIGTRRLLYPYRNRAPISEAEMSLKYPNAWEYLLGNRNVLGGRASLLKGSGKFYELVRPREQMWLERPKLLIRDLAPRTSFAMDDRGAAYLVGGTAVAPHDIEILPALMAYLNSEFVDAHVRQSTAGFQGGYQKYEPKHLQAIPVLQQFLDDSDFQSLLSHLAWRAALVTEDPSELALVEADINAAVTRAARAAGVV